jgi:hypothetical protein
VNCAKHGDTVRINTAGMSRRNLMFEQFDFSKCKRSFPK